MIIKKYVDASSILRSFSLLKFALSFFGCAVMTANNIAVQKPLLTRNGKQRLPVFPIACMKPLFF